MIDMDEAKLQTVAQVKAFLEGTHDIVLKIPKAEHYGFIEKILKLVSYIVHYHDTRKAWCYVILNA